MKKILIPLFFLSLFLIAAIYAFFYVNQWVNSKEIKNQITKRLNYYLKTELNIGDVDFDVDTRLSLKDVIVRPQDDSDLSLKGVERIKLSFNLNNIIKQDFNIPSIILLEKPKFQLLNFSFQKLFQGNLPKFTVPIALQLKDASFSLFKVNGVDTGLRIAKAEISLKGDGQIKVKFQGSFFGSVEGKVSGQGNVGHKLEDVDMQFNLEGVRQSVDGVNVLRDLNGLVRLRQDNIVFENMDINLLSFPVQLGGNLTGFNKENPSFMLKILQSKVELLDIEGDFEKNRFDGNINLLEREIELGGSLIKSEEEIIFIQDSWGEGKTAQLRVLIPEKQIQIGLVYGKQRYDAQFSLEDMDIQLDLKVDHLNIYDFDIVTSTHIKFKPQKKEWNLNDFALDASVNTDYFIFNYEPLKDFKGNFTFSIDGLSDVAITWGELYSLKGDIKFKDPGHVDLDLECKDVSLDQMTSLGFHALPSGMIGEMDGKVKIRGEAKQPEVSGYISIENGNIDNQSYDHLILNFYGNRHYLKLKDSNVSKDGRTFQIQGDVDFSNKNILSGVEVVKDGVFSIWSGKKANFDTLDNVSDPGQEKSISQLETRF